jgi:hypothetical protein
MTTTLNAVETFRATPAPVFGGLVAWDLPCTNDKTLIDVREALERVGLSAELMPARSHEQTMCFATDLFEAESAKSLLVRKIRNDKDSTVYGIVNETKDRANDKLEYQQETTVSMDKATGHLTGSGPHFDAFVAKFSWVRTHALPVDIQRIMLKVVAEVRGIAYRHGGGTYFYAASDKNVTLTTAATNFVKVLGVTPSHVSNLPLSGGPIQKAEVFYATAQEVRKQVEQIKKAAENVTKRASSLSNHESQLNDVKELMNYYMSLTAMEEAEESREAEAKAMRDLIAETETVITKKMAEVEALRKSA